MAMKRFRVTIAISGQPDINVIVEANGYDQARRFAQGQYPHGRILNIVQA